MAKFSKNVAVVSIPALTANQVRANKAVATRKANQAAAAAAAQHKQDVRNAAGQKAAATKRANKAAAVTVAAPVTSAPAPVAAPVTLETLLALMSAAGMGQPLTAPVAAPVTMTPGQRAAETKRASGGHFAAAAKAAATKRANKAALIAAAAGKPVQGASDPVALGKLLALIPALKAAGLI